MTRKKRLQKIIDNECNGNVKEFSELLGMSRPDRLYNVLNDKNGLSEKLALLITDKFTNYTFAWLFTGVIKDDAINDIEVELKNDFNELINDLNSLISKIKKQPKTIENINDLQKAIEMKQKVYEDFKRLRSI